MKVSPLRYRLLIEQEAHRRRLPVSWLMSHEKVNKAVWTARWAVWRELRRQGFSYPGIGSACGKHHTTVLHGVQRINAIDQLRSASVAYQIAAE